MSGTDGDRMPVDWSEEPVPNLATYDSYDQARAAFEWDIPETYNIATDVVSSHADARGRVALFQEIEGTGSRTHTFWQLERRSNELANAMAARGISRGDRVAIVGSRSDLVMLTNLAAWKLGAISVPLSVLYGPDGLGYRLEDCEPSIVFTAPDRIEAVTEAIADVDSIDLLVGYENVPSVDDIDTTAFTDLTGEFSFDPVQTDPTDPALILYTSGTTGEPKGVLQAHQALIGWLPSFQMCFELPWQEDDPVLYATPDLAWIGGLNLVLGAWHYGFPAFRHDEAGGFKPTRVFDNIEKWGLTRAVLVPGMLKPMSKLDVDRWDLSTLSVVMSGSEPVSEPLYEFVTQELGANLNEMYGQTEALHVVTSCSQWFDVEPGSLGFPAPGHAVSIIDTDTGEEQPEEEVGMIAVKRPDPAIFRALWNDPEQTEQRFVGDWMETEDLGYRDEDGRFWFTSRADNLIITQGYRVAPPEVENSILQLDVVTNVGVIGVPDSDGSEIIKAFVQLTGDAPANEAMKERIQNHVRDNLAKYQYPREIEFVDELPTTVTGKIKRHKLEAWQ